MLIHGDADTLVPPEHTQDLASACTSNVDTQIIRHEPRFDWQGHKKHLQLLKEFTFAQDETRCHPPDIFQLK